MAKIYVSSTRLDLKEFRETVSRAIRRSGHEDVAMENYVAEHRPPVGKCLEDVAGCDLYVGLFAWRYGWVPEEDNPSRLSVTEMEYRQALKSGRHCLVFLLSDEAPWPLKFVDSDRTRIEALRDELGAKHSSGPPFKTADELGRLVAEAIHQWEKEHGHTPQRPSLPELDLTAYINALTRRYQHLDLDALTPPQRDENLRQRLREIFVEQNVRENPPPVELPKEVWEKLQRDREIHPEDLPTGVTPEDILRARESYFEKPSRPVLEALTDPAHRRSVVLGDPGSGKSTLARYVLLSLVGVEGDERLSRAFEGHLPLLIELRSYAGLCSEAKDSTFLDFVEFMSDSEGWGLDRKALEHYLKTDGRAVVVFDGLDEIFDPEDRESAARRIAGFAGTYPKAHILVTSRVIGYKRKVLTDAEFSHFTLQDLDERQVEQFIDRWYALALDERPDEARARRERIMRSFDGSASIRQLAGNPMLLTIMAIIGKNQELPRERWKLYDHAAGVLIYHWDVERHLRDRHLNAPFIGEEEKKELLRRLAYKMQSGEGGLAGNYIHRDDLQREFEDYLRDRFAQPPAEATTIARAMIDQFRERNFILSLYGGNLYGFVHRAFLEFFCASAFVQKFEKTRELTFDELKHRIFGGHLYDRNWHEVLRLICGMVDEKFTAEIIAFLSDESCLPWSHYSSSVPPWNIALSIQVLGEVKSIGAVAEPARRLLETTCSLFDFCMTTNYTLNAFMDETIATAAQAVGANWPHRTVIIEWLRTPHWYVYGNYYARAFGRFIGALCKDMDEVRQLLTWYASQRSVEYRVLVPYALAAGWHDDPETLSVLEKIAESDGHSVVRGAALWSMVEYFPGDQRVLEWARRLAVNDGNGELRSLAIQALVTHARSDPQTWLLVRHRLRHDVDHRVQRAAYDAIRKYSYIYSGNSELTDEINKSKLTLSEWLKNEGFGRLGKGRGFEFDLF
ncbi:MAG TPA: DUF4062 domain-containing protein [Pyrinomonadaceae bacterium]|jgi:hypothetical protein